MADHGDGNIKVVVRCRPLNARELARGARPLVRMSGNQTLIDPPEPGSAQEKASSGRATERKTMAFSFDKSYWSAGPREEPGYCSQQTLFDDLGKELLDHGFAGFNACILAYGQTGSGKSYSELFVRVANKCAADQHLKFTVEVSYIEIYNEKVRDLLNPKNTGNLRVREHPILGPYVEDLSKLAVNNYDEMMTLMDEGNKARTVAATNMNETSSRSHAVFTLILTMMRHDVDTKLDTEKVSRISLVDLAGSERANSTGATVISSLAAASSGDGKKGKKKGEDFVPYRDSVLTWLLKDSLGGNSKTAMIAAISPADYEETLSTLRYADQAKKIKNKAVVNEDPNAKLVRELKEELDMLRARVAGSSGEDVYDSKIPPERQKVTYKAKDGTLKTVTKAELQDQLESSEKLMQSLNETWEEKLQRTQEVQKEREKALEELGIRLRKITSAYIHQRRCVYCLVLSTLSIDAASQMPHLVNLVGRLDSEKAAHIRLSGDNILEEHCYFENTDGKVTLHTVTDAITFLNGNKFLLDSLISSAPASASFLVNTMSFVFNNPEEVRKQRDRATMRSNLQFSLTAAPLGSRPDSPASSSGEQEDVDWTFAKREAALARLGLDPALDSLPDEDLNKLYERITLVKNIRDHNQKHRPESSLSQADDVWSESGRPFSSDALTDDTSVDAGPSRGSPDVDALKEVQNQLETQRQEFESRLRVISESTEAEDLKEEKDHMQHQLKLVQMQMRRLLDARARGETELIRKVLDKWRAHRSFSMAETVLSAAVIMKEANQELGKDVSYNFTVASGGSLAAPMSSINTIAGLDEFGDVADPVLASATQPTVAVKVLDKRHNAIYVWSLDRLRHQMQRMRNLTSFIDRPSYSQHFSSEEPLYNSPPPEYSFVHR
ncbi:P-loop containing nucleoside triphosphate hydrolase protein [Lactarius hatsudake]|nr:P-loop containing nucleoside triphosphate hydrolase protein [Lactarius hatsudake]